MKHFSITLLEGKYIKMFILCISLVFSFIYSKGASETYIQTLSGSHLKAGAICEVKDDKFQNNNIVWDNITNLSVYDVITFEIRQDTALYYYDKPFSATLNVDIAYYTSPDQSTPTKLENVKLKVKFDTTTGHPYAGIAMFKFKGAYRVRVKVNSMTSSQLGTPLPAIFRLKNEIFIERKYLFNPSITDVTTYELVRNKLALYWNPAHYPGAEKYDLEWTFIDDSSLAAASIRSTFTSGTLITVPNEILEGWMYHNATRITTPAYSYKINLPYNGGYIIYRVRGVQTAINGVRKTTNWTYKAMQGTSTGSSVVAINGMEESINWQYIGAFSEEGKRKEDISFFDGTLRKRQSVTLNNSVNRSIVQETVYDAMGRPSAQVLPAPVKDSMLRYFDSFNKNAAGTAPYNYINLDQTTACAVTPQAMTDVSGAAQYYSPNNSFPTSNTYFFNKYIPDANGFPFSVTTYTADNTSRIKRQGGVGNIFQPGNGHDTRYFYGKPQQEELDRLFGSEAGNAQHFLKNMVVDPNGQVSVSYINASGQTVATALAGTPPDNLHALPGAGTTAKNITEEMLKPESLQYNASEHAIVASASFNVPVNGNYDFNYEVDPLSLNTAYGTSGHLQICSDCYYDLSIIVTDDCATVIHEETHDAGTVFDSTCAPPPISGHFSLTNLSIGTYNVAYELKVSKTALDFYDSRFVRVNTDLKTLADFTRKQIKNSDFGNCFADCKTCMETLGTRPSFKARFTMLFDQYNINYDTDYQNWLDHLYDSLYAQCQAIQCPTETHSVCYHNYQRMLKDVTPGGQYALYDENYHLLEPDINILRFYTTTTFTDENGNPDYVMGDLGYAVPPSVLSLQEFIRHFKPSWADSLVTHHPEYCYYQWCLVNPDSEEFDDKVLNDLTDAASATASGVFDGEHYTTLLFEDPFFQPTGNGYSMVTEMIDSLGLFSKSLGMNAPYYDALAVAKWAVTCGQLGQYIGGCNVDESCINMDLVWNTYKTYYLQLKSKFYERARESNSNCTNCYIGSGLLPDSIAFNECRSCPVGYTLSQDGTYCYKDVPDPSTGDNYTVVDSWNKDYSMYGSFIYEPGFCWDGTSKFERHRLAPYTQYFWSNYLNPHPLSPDLVKNGTCESMLQSNLSSTEVTYEDSTAHVSGQHNMHPMVSVSGPLNRCGIWNTGNHAPYDEWIGVAAWVYFPETKTYYFGMGGDNGYRVNIDNQLLISKSDLYQYLNFRLWHIYPKVVTKGYHIISIKGKNNCCDVGSFGMEVYNNTPAQLAAATQYSQLNVLFTTASFVGKPFSTNFNCPSGSVPYTEGSTTGCRYIKEAGSGLDIPSNSASYMDKQRIYNQYIDFTPFENQIGYKDTTQLKAEAQQNAIDVAKENCTYMADVWMSQLSGCTANASLMAQVRQGLIAVCQKGCEYMQENGASTLPSGVVAVVGSHSYTSFEDVINQLMGSGGVNRFCNADLITMPYPYDRQVQLSDLKILKTNNVICAKLTGLQNEWQTSGFSGTFHAYLKMIFGRDYHLSEVQLGELQQSCGACNFLLKEELTLPAYFAEDAPDALSCTQVQNALTEIFTQYPSLSPDDAIYETLIANYINHKYGYGLTYADYRYFADSVCPVSSGTALYVKAPIQDVAIDSNACVAKKFGRAVTLASIAYKAYIDSVHQAFRNAFLTKCMSITPRLTMNSSLWEYQYTLYYYDQAGNLVKTVPPKGVHPLSDEGLDSLRLYRNHKEDECYATSGYYILKPPAETAASFGFNTYLGGANPFTLEMWVKLSNHQAQGLVGNLSTTEVNPGVYATSGFSLRLFNDLLILYSNPGKQYSDAQGVQFSHATIGYYEGIHNYIPLNEWTHIVVQSTGTFSPTFSMYVNGVALPVSYLSREDIGPDSFVPVGGLEIGASRDEAGSLYGIHNGSIKQFRYYTRNLSAAEVAQNYAASCLMPSNTSGLVMWAPLDGSDIKDIAGGKTGQMSGSPSWFELHQVIPPVFPKHTLASYYTYNSLNKVVRQTSPDGGTTQYWYDRVGRPLASQNSEQRTINGIGRYNYNKYDALGRIIETGEKLNSLDLNGFDTRDSFIVKSWLAAGTDRYITYIVYDTAIHHPDITPYQTNLRKRITAVFHSIYEEISYYNAATYYSYDIAGNVKTLWQDLVIPLTDVKRIDYDYDIIAGKVNELSYQKGKGDQFFYKYTYDADNRVIALETSREGLIWHNDARYRYYLHGPLARMELGGRKVQGTDYAYTLQGWLKGINSSFLKADKDMAQDGSSGIYKPFARDVYGFSLGYYDNDYAPVGGTNAEAFSLEYNPPTSLTSTGNELFNGNISYSTLALSKFNSGLPVGYSYGYDQLNRILAMRQHSIGSGVNSWSNHDIIADYKEDISYDANGNILSYLRNGTTQDGNPLAMDNLTYHYQTNSNQLGYITDAVAAGNYANDLDNQSADNYAYDKIGNLIKDDAAGINNIKWTADGKLEQISRSDTNLLFYYDGNGNRTMKGNGYYGEYYIRDAQGNILAVYDYNDVESKLKWAAQSLYGSSRIGRWNWHKTIPSRVMLPESESDTLSEHYLIGSRDYELTNHLGNVLSVISDKKVGVSSGGNTVDYYKAEVLSQQDYYPFGMTQPGRQYALNDYRYGFNGKENDQEISGWQDYGMREYDRRTGRFISVDPLAEERMGVSPYSYVQNNPLNKIDPSGALDSPIYDEKTGDLLGTDDKGLQGTAIVMNKNDFTQGMSHEDALEKDVGVGNMSLEAMNNLTESFISLPSRPDWDGYLTLEEANEWYRTGRGQPLFTDLSKIDLSGIYSLGEKYVGQVKAFNLLLNSGSLNDGLVYGNITLKRYPNHQVRAFADKYDFEMHNPWNPLNWGRNVETVIGRKVAGEGTPFEINIHGSATLKPLFPWTK